MMLGWRKRRRVRRRGATCWALHHPLLALRHPPPTNLLATPLTLLLAPLVPLARSLSPMVVSGLVVATALLLLLHVTLLVVLHVSWDPLEGGGAVLRYQGASPLVSLLWVLLGSVLAFVRTHLAGTGAGGGGSPQEPLRLLEGVGGGGG